jgi:hypothetical protein
VTVSAYRAVGGIPSVTFLEDDALVRALERADFKVRRSPQVRVKTSARLDGRAEVGLAWQLRQWESVGGAARDPVVEAPKTYLAALKARRELRLRWRLLRANCIGGTAATADCLEVLADKLMLAPGRLDDLLARPRPFGELWDDIEQTRREELVRQGRVMPVSRAVVDLRRLVREHERAVLASDDT